MRKTEREMLQRYVNSSQIYEKEKGDAFRFLQKKNKEVTGHGWCSAEMNYKDLLKAGHDYTREYDKYIEASAKVSAIQDLGIELARLNFWK